NPTNAGASGVIAGWGKADGRPIVVISHDAAVAGGAIGEVFAQTVQRAQRLAIDKGYPIIYINDSGGARIHDGILALHGCGGIVSPNVAPQPRVPQVSIICGPCAAAPA